MIYCVWCLLPDPWNFPYPWKFPHPVFLQVFIHNLIPVLPYSGSSPYTVKASIQKSAYLLEINNTQKQKLSGLNGYWYVLFPFFDVITYFNSHVIVFHIIPLTHYHMEYIDTYRWRTNHFVSILRSFLLVAEI